jgi:hypothetical protein
MSLAATLLGGCASVSYSRGPGNPDREARERPAGGAEFRRSMILAGGGTTCPAGYHSGGSVCLPRDH